MILFDVNNFGPFNAEVWGTTSDWFMFAVTGITAIYLIKTFRSQKEVQRLQQEVTSIEIARHKSEIMPIFKVELADSCFVKEKAGVLSIQADFRVKLERSNVANDLKLILNFKNQDKWAVNPECKLLFNQFLPSYTTYVECFYESKVKPTEDMVRFNTAFDQY